MFGWDHFWIGTLAGAGGLIVGAAAVAILTSRRMHRLRARERRAQINQRFAEVAAMTAGLAHEIKNPLSTIGLNAQLLAESVSELEIAADEKSRLTRRLETLGREVERLRGILTDFLDFAGGIHLDVHEQDVNAVVDELIDFFRPQAEQASVRLRSVLACEPLLAPIDAPHVKQALLNLMLNAVQAMQTQPGELIIRTERQTEPDGSRAVAIHVTDTGPGMDEETKTRVFQPYFTTKSGGSGLGMPTTRRLIEAHGGRVQVFSESGKGTNVTVILPTASPQHVS